jgi:hypothetical protein
MFHQLIQRAWRDAAFKAQLLADPKPCLAQNGVEVPDGIELVFHENTANVMHLVLPDNSQVDAASSEGCGAGFRAVMQRACDDPAFQARLCTDAKGAIAALTGARAPAPIELIVHRNSPATWHFAITIDPGTPELDELNRYVIGGSMMSPRAGR